MLSKCANPHCSTPFLYLHRGQLFRIETASGMPQSGGFEHDDGSTAPARRLEYFWLCEECAPSMTLRFDREIGVSAMPAFRSKAATV